MPRGRSTAYHVTESTLHLTGNAATGLFRWAATNHCGMSQALSYMPRMGFIDTLNYILIQFLISILGAVLSAVWIVFLLFIAFPYVLFGTTLIP